MSFRRKLTPRLTIDDDDDDYNTFEDISLRSNSGFEPNYEHEKNDGCFSIFFRFLFSFRK